MVARRLASGRRGAEEPRRPLLGSQSRDGLPVTRPAVHGPCPVALPAELDRVVDDEVHGVAEVEVHEVLVVHRGVVEASMDDGEVHVRVLALGHEELEVPVGSFGPGAQVDAVLCPLVPVKLLVVLLSFVLLFLVRYPARAAVPCEDGRLDVHDLPGLDLYDCSCVLADDLAEGPRCGVRDELRQLRERLIAVCDEAVEGIEAPLLLRIEGRAQDPLGLRMAEQL